MRDEIEDIVRHDFKGGKLTPERKLKMDGQKRQSIMENREVKRMDRKYVAIRLTAGERGVGER